MKRLRADTLLAERGLSPSRTAAARSVRAGRVRIGADGPYLVRPSELVPESADLRVEGEDEFVSRGGFKLANALEAFGIDPSGRRSLDVGASTGGFTDCLLRRGADRVVALDVGYGQLAASLREDPRVEVLERSNARELTSESLSLRPDLVVVDVSFISLTKVLGPVVSVAAESVDLLAMVKPQFELGRARVGRGGVVRNPADRAEAVVGVAEAGRGLGLSVRGFASSGLPGPKGNLETFIWFDRGGPEPDDLRAAVEEAGP